MNISKVPSIKWFLGIRSTVLIPVCLALVLLSGCSMLQFGRDTPAGNDTGTNGEIQLVSDMMLAGGALQKVDVLDMEGTAGLKSGQRTRFQTKLQEVAEDYARKYRDDLLRLAKFPIGRVEDAFAIRLRTESNNRGIPGRRKGPPWDAIEMRTGIKSKEHSVETAKTIQIHLRLTRAKVPPSHSEIIRDFRNLRYLKIMRSPVY